MREHLLWLVPALAACGEEPTAQPTKAPTVRPAEEAGGAWFVEEAGTRGLDFRHVSGHREGSYYFPELMGGGVALLDAEGDGDLDVFLVQGGSLHADGPPTEHVLFMNDGAGLFTRGQTIRTDGYGMGVACGDVDEDGDVDIYLTAVGRNMLLLNDGAGRFSASDQAADPAWGTSACFFDAEGDGDLDLFVANYVDWSVETEQECFDPTGQPDYCSPVSYEAPARDSFYRNEGGGVFVEATAEAGLDAARGNGLGVVPGDFDGDGDLDLFVANDQTADLLWRNDGSGRFEDVGELRCVARDRQGGVRAGMGVDCADVDRDGDLDLIVVHMAREADGYFINEGSYFVERTHNVGLATANWRYTRFGVGLRDLDQDGWLDLFVANGRVNMMMAPVVPDDPFAEPNTLLRGTPEGRYLPAGPEGGTSPVLLETARGAAFGDVDGDGALDVVIVNKDGPVHLLRNVAQGRGHGLTVRLIDGVGDALGAQATIIVGGERQRRDVLPAGSYCSSSDPRVHVGLGDAERVDAVRVRWLDGSEEVFGPFDADQFVTLRRGEGR